MCGEKMYKTDLPSKRKMWSYKVHQTVLNTKRCQICVKEINETNREAHHIIPISHGGRNNKRNLVVLCSECHFKAHNKRN